MKSSKGAGDGDHLLAHKKVVRSWSTINHIVTSLDELAEKIKAASGTHCDRSKILNVLAEIVIESQDKIDMTSFVDKESLKQVIQAAIRRRR